MPIPSITPPARGSSSTREEESLSAAASSSSTGCSFRFLPAFCLGVVAAVAFQLSWGGLTLTSFFLKLFIYLSFALLCFLAGSFVLLVRKSPLKVSRFDRSRRQSAARLHFFSKLMVRSLSHTHTHTRASNLHSNNLETNTNPTLHLGSLRPGVIRIRGTLVGAREAVWTVVLMFLLLSRCIYFLVPPAEYNATISQ